MIVDLAVISATMSPVIILLIAFTHFFGKKHRAKYRYIAWLLVTIRLLIPYRFDFDSAPITFSEPQVLQQPIFDPQPQAEPADKALPDMTDNLPSETVTPEIEENNDGKNPIKIPLSFIITFVWAAGAVCFIAYHIIVLALFNRKIKKTLIPQGKSVYLSDMTGHPMMTGFFKKRIIIPDISLSDEEIRLIVLHENTHFARKDIWYKLLLVIANAIHWFNPFVYFMVRFANRDLEYSCDDVVTKNMSTEEKKKYSLVLLKFMNTDTKKEDKK